MRDLGTRKREMGQRRPGKEGTQGGGTGASGGRQEGCGHAQVGWGKAGEEEGRLSGLKSRWRTDLKHPCGTRVLGCALFPGRTPLGTTQDDVPLPTPYLPPLLPEKLPKFAL